MRNILNSIFLMLVAMLLPGVSSKYQLMRDYTWTYQYTLIMNVDKRPVKKSEKRLKVHKLCAETVDVGQ